MNILFFTDCDVYALRGGIDRVVGVLCNSLIKQDGYKCFLAYFDKTPNKHIAPFEKRTEIDKENFYAQLSNFISENKIDKIVVSTMNKQHIHFLLPKIKQIAKKISVYFWFHGAPTFEIIPINLKVAIYRLMHNKDKIANFKKMLFSVFSIPFLHKLGVLMLHKKYAFTCRYTDKIILLSKYYINEYAACAKEINKEKFTYISNFLSFDVVESDKIIEQKEKIVLIVSRLEEQQKRILIALKIWQRIEQQNRLSDWKLIILGTGEDETYYKNFANKLRLKNCVFEGQQNPIEYYKKASIFIMTSSFEGFGLTLTEAQQNGVVPIVFDSFKAVYDIIEDNFNGVIVENNNIKEYAQKLTFLMQNDKERQILAKNALESCKKFSPENIVEKWKDLFEK